MSESVEEESKKEKNAFDIIKTWFLNSPTHGIRRISRTNSALGRLFWSLTFLTFTTLMCVFIYTVIRKFTAHPTKISLSVKPHRDADHIPTITFCNLNPLRKESFLYPNKYSVCRATTDSERHNCFTEYMSEILARNMNNSRPVIVESGYKLNELLIQCTFNGRSCEKSFLTFFHPNYGNCYTFNHTNNTELNKKENLTRSWTFEDENIGDGYRLFLELYLHQNEYIHYLDNRAAIRIFLHRKNEIPILSQNNFFLAPKTFTKLTFSQRMITFSQRCRNDLTDDMKEVFTSHSARYSQALCFKLCEFRFIEDICRCTDRLFMVFLQFFSQNRTKQMNAPCPIQHNCLADRTDFNRKESCSECLPECELVQYTIQSSYADYPNARSIDAVFQRVEKHIGSVGNGTSQSSTATCFNKHKEDVIADIVAVEILASPYATEVLAESPMYTWVDLISSIGGQTGLWIGVSLISFVEIVELVVLLLCHLIKIISEKLRNQYKRLKRLFSRENQSENV